MAAVRGEVDLGTVDQFRAGVAECVRQVGRLALVVDLTAVTFSGPYRLTALVQAARRAGEPEGPLRVVVDARHPVIWPIELTGLDQVLALHQSVDDALAQPTP